MSRIRNMYALISKLSTSRCIAYLSQQQHAFSQNTRILNATCQRVFSSSSSSNDISNTLTPEVVDDKERGSLELRWSHGEKLEFAKIFLRDHCRCSECFNANSNNRLLEPYTIPLDVTPTNIQISEQSLEISWSDNHTSTYSFEYLRTVQRGLDQDVRYIKPTLWKVGDLKDGELPRYDLAEVVEDERTMWRWFLDLKKLGITILTNAGTTPGALNLCREKIFGGYYKATHYG